MPISTDKLADDIDAIRADLTALRKEVGERFDHLRGEMNGRFDHLRTEINTSRIEAMESIASLRSDLRAEANASRIEAMESIASLRSDLGEFKGEAKVIFGLLKWVGGALVVAFTTQAAAAIWYAAKLDSRIGYQEQRIEKLEKTAEPKPARSN